MTVTALGMVLTPWPNMMYLVSRIMSQGRNAGLIPQFIDPHRGHTTTQGFLLGGMRIAVSQTVNALIVVAVGAIAGFVKHRPTWAAWQRRTTGTLLGTVAVLLVCEVPARARV